MRILLLGKTGKIGYELWRTLSPLGDITALSYPEIDYMDPNQIKGLVRDQKPDVIVNAVGYTMVDKAEFDVKCAMQLNATVPGILANEAHKLGSLLVHFSTDYVYDGTKVDPYVETDAPNPLNVYGNTKMIGDSAVIESGCYHMIFRLSWVYGTRRRNFMRAMMKLARENDQIRVVSGQTGAPTWARMVAEVVAHAARAAEIIHCWGYQQGVYNLSAGGSTTWYEFAKAIVEAMPAGEVRCKEVLPIPSGEYVTAAKRPLNSVLCNDKLMKTFGLTLPPWQRGLELALELPYRLTTQ